MNRSERKSNWLTLCGQASPDGDLVERRSDLSLEILCQRSQPDEQCDLEDGALVEGHVRVIRMYREKPTQLTAFLSKRAQVDDRPQTAFVAVVQADRPAFLAD